MSKTKTPVSTWEAKHILLKIIGLFQRTTDRLAIKPQAKWSILRARNLSQRIVIIKLRGTRLKTRWKRWENSFKMQFKSNSLSIQMERLCIITQIPTKYPMDKQISPPQNLTKKSINFSKSPLSSITSIKCFYSNLTLWPPSSCSSINFFSSSFFSSSISSSNNSSNSNNNSFR